MQQRHLSDSQVNNRRSKTLRNGKLKDEKWSAVQVIEFSIFQMKDNKQIWIEIESSSINEYIVHCTMILPMIITFKTLIEIKAMDKRIGFIVNVVFRFFFLNWNEMLTFFLF